MNQYTYLTLSRWGATLHEVNLKEWRLCQTKQGRWPFTGKELTLAAKKSAEFEEQIGMDCHGPKSSLIDSVDVLSELADRFGISREQLRSDINMWVAELREEERRVEAGEIRETHLTLLDVRLADIVSEYLEHADVCAFCGRLVEPLTLPK